MKAAEEGEESGGTRRRIPKLKIFAKIWNNRKAKNQDGEEQLDGVQQEEEQHEEQLDEVTRRLIFREEELFSQDAPSEEEEDQLQKDFESLSVQIWMAVHDTFSPSAPSGEVLRNAVDSIQQQEKQDQRWRERPKEKVPVWRPQRWLSSHHKLLQKMVEVRLSEAAESDSAGTQQLSSDVKRQVCRMGKRLKEDLLMVARKVKDCYPVTMDILNVYGALYHQTFSARLAALTAAGLDIDDCSYVLFWVNHYYPEEILKNPDLEGQIKTPCLGSLLLQDNLRALEEQYLLHKEEKIQLWLNTLLKKEEENWLGDKHPELIDSYYFSPLAIDIIQMFNSSLTELGYTISSQDKAQRLTVHLENFLSSYRKCVDELLKAAPSNLHTVMKAQLVCEQQLRDYVTGLSGGVSEEQRRRCLEDLAAIRAAGYRCFIWPLHQPIKVHLSKLWTSSWMDGSSSVIDPLLNFLIQQLDQLSDLKPACKQVLLEDLHLDVVVQYVAKTMKARMKSRQQQVAGSQRVVEDAQKMESFFKEQGCGETLRLSEMLCSLAEILRLQDPASLHLEVVNLAQKFPDFSDAHVSALLSLKFGLSALDIRSIRASVEENRPPQASANQSPAFFSRVKVKWINNKINQMRVKSKSPVAAT
ncbi:tumor necrosis factor alpha-induced protein 2a isoform X2 [Cyprinodon tularosa]|uniref:tumor necrosis factor alpha-induced protein 2a isoform X2 n=1 Tax=Cyprinodon tularosa TaxID=77115 RepID=UPI0018E25E3B|nr:tumor necrosis factor alpha-induced protein 2a isoform X2 [Cyprinodon tularosa]